MKKKTIATSVSVVVLITGVLVASYAYLVARVTNNGQTATTVKAQTLDGLVFDEDENISLALNPENFDESDGDLSSVSNPSVSLQTSDSAAASYNSACLNIKKNSFVHSAISQTTTGTTGNLTNNLIKYTPSTKTSSYGVGFNRNSDQSVDIIGTASPTGYRQYSTYTLMNENLELESGTYYTNLMPENVELIGIDDDTTGYITLATNTKSYFTLPKTTHFLVSY